MACVWWCVVWCGCAVGGWVWWGGLGWVGCVCWWCVWVGWGAAKWWPMDTLAADSPPQLCRLHRQPLPFNIRRSQFCSGRRRHPLE